MSLRTIRRALLSVSDKSGLLELAKALVEHRVELVSTGGTRKALETAGCPAKDISEMTGFPEMLDGRVKTLHPRVHGGLLAVRDNADHVKTAAEHQIPLIDLVVCNLYPFEKTAANPGSSHEEIVENIDIGGPSMIRSAAKNYESVSVLTDPEQYPTFIDEFRSNKGAVSAASRERWAAAAFERTASYDQAIAAYFSRRGGGHELPNRLVIRFDKKMPLRYGENPHQQAAFYIEPGASGPCMATAEQIHGKELSFNNLLDLDSGWNLVREFERPAAVIIKHNNPCGAAVADLLAPAFIAAYEGDPLSAYGGILAFNRVIDEPTAMQITEPNRFVEAIIAPDFESAALRLIRTRPTWHKNVRLLKAGSLDSPVKTSPWNFRRVDGGLLVQSRDQSGDDFVNSKCVTHRRPTEQELADLRFAWQVCKHVKSNAIVLAQGGRVVGVGAGQMSRVDSVAIAVEKAGERARGSVLASDAFFPFRDNVDTAAAAGIMAIVQPGGSMRDPDSIQACDANGLAMVFTSVRHFRH